MILQFESFIAAVEFAMTTKCKNLTRNKGKWEIEVCQK